MSHGSDPASPQPTPEHSPPEILVVPVQYAHAASPRPVPRPVRRRWLLPLLLYITTWVTTWYTGAWLAGMDDPRIPGEWHEKALGGFRYAGPVMLILTAHELGHFIQAVRYRIPASFPWFIPMLNLFGTMGAVIVQRAGVATRRQMFDIAITGPLAGLVFTIPIVLWGLSESRIEAFAPDAPGLRFGDPLLLRWLAQWYLGPLGPNEDYTLNPPLMAGWVGIFITALNLFPIGQLDGGHILYCLLGPSARVFTRYLYRVLAAIVLVGGLFDPRYLGWLVMLILLTLGGVEHPPTANDAETLGPVRVALGWATLLFVVVGFTPIPIL